MSSGGGARSSKRKRGGGDEALAPTRRRRASGQTPTNDPNNASNTTTSASKDPQEGTLAATTDPAATTTPTTSAASSEVPVAAAATADPKVETASVGVPPNSKNEGESSSRAVATKNQQQQQEPSEGASTTAPAVATASTSADAATTPAASAAADMKMKNDTSADAAVSQEGTSEEPSRLELMQGLIHHRTILLQRMKECRTAAESRLATNATVILKVKPAAPTKEDTASVKKEEPKDEPKEEAKDEDEVTAFAEMTKQAMAIAKQLRDGENNSKEMTPNSKRSSISLRRGASVGKKMSAAISSLVPGGQYQQQQQPHASAAADPPVVGSSSATSNTKSASAAQHAQPVAIAPSSGIPHQKQLQQQPPSSSSNHPTNTKTTTTTKGMKRATPTLPKSSTKQRAPKSGTSGTSGSRATPRPDSATSLPQHAASQQQQQQQLPHHRTAAITSTKPQPPVVHYPQAMALRERKAQLELQLMRLQERHRAQADGVPFRQVSSSRLTSSKYHAHSTPSMKPHHHSKPQRRKTQWDYVLQEMSWLATDFVQERQWKQSAARTLSHAVQSNAANSRINTSTTLTAKPPSVAPSKSSSNKSKSDDDENDRSMTSVAGGGTASSDNKYVPCGMEDLAYAKRSATYLSAMVTSTSNSENDSKSSQQQQQQRLQALRTKLFQGSVPNNNTNDSMDVDENEEGTSHDESTATTTKAEQTFEEITSHVTQRLEEAQQLLKSSSRTASTDDDSSSSSTIELSSEQQKALRFMRELWKKSDSDDPTAALLCTDDGTVGATGKTVTACALLSKSMQPQEGGLQLVLCAPASVARWRYELERAGCQAVRSVGPSMEGEPLTSEQYNAGDVVVCEYSALPRFLEILSTKKHKLVSCTIDCRHALGFAAAAASPAKESSSSSSSWISDGPPELVSVTWWNALLECCRTSGARRMLIDYSAVGQQQQGQAQKEQLSLLALRAAFVLGPSLFYSKAVSLQRRVASWARRRGKISKVTVKDKVQRVRTVLLEEIMNPLAYTLSLDSSSEESSATSWEGHLCPLEPIQQEAYDNLCLELRGILSERLVDSHGASRNESSSISNALLRLRTKCVHADMPGLLWNDAILASRLGSLSKMIMTATTITSTSTDKNTKSSRGTSTIFYRPIPSNPSQPDHCVTEHILKGSSKLKELVSLLVLDGSIAIHSEAEAAVQTMILDGDENKEDKNKKNKTARKRSKGASKQQPHGKDDKEPPKKVAILASMPELQLLVSVLLSSLGVQHELLLHVTSSSLSLPASLGTGSGRTVGDHANVAQAELEQSKTSAVAWALIQKSLVQFRTSSSSIDEDPNSDDSVVNVVVASPEAVACHHGGIGGVDYADVIICLDDDWSGRGAFLMQSIAARSSRAYSLAFGDEKKQRLVRLISEGTIEETMLASNTRDSSSSMSNSHSNSNRYTTNAAGYYDTSNIDAIFATGSLPNDDESDEGSNICSFPGSSLLRFRGTPLSQVLACQKPLPRVFASGKEHVFLPFQDSADLPVAIKRKKQDENAAEAALLKGLLRSEEAAAAGAVLSMSHEPSLSSSSFKTLSPFCASPPEPSLFPKEVLSCKDVGSLPTQMYLERFANASKFGQASSTSAPDGVAFGDSSVPSDPASVVANDPSAVSSSSEFGDSSSSSLRLFPSKPDMDALSLLVYSHDTSSSSVAEKENSSPSASSAATMQTKRQNAYAKCFASASGSGNKAKDDSQGSESLVYCPPLFPKLLECADQANKDTCAILHPDLDPETGLPYENVAIEGGEGAALKRKEMGSAEGEADAKRLKTDPTTQNPKPENGVPSASTTGATTATNGSNKSALFGIDEDYGLLGFGAIPLPGDCAIAAGQTASSDAALNSSGGIGSDPFVNVLACDVEESAMRAEAQTQNNELSSMLLFVKKKPKGFPILSEHHTAFHRPGHAPAPIAPAGTVIPASDTAAGKKKKKSTTPQNANPAGSSAFMRPPSMSTDAFQRMPTHAPGVLKQGKDSFRHRVHGSFLQRQYNTGFTMFESSAFRLAVVRVQNRVVNNLKYYSWRSGLSYEAGPGLPLFAGKEIHAISTQRMPSRDPCRWTNIVRPPSSSGTKEDMSQIISKKQLDIFERSLATPCRVDFGPFRSGFLPELSGMSGITHARARVGVSLPMGVKIPHTSRTYAATHQWTELEDKRLHEYTLMYGMNWMLIARALSAATKSSTKSARQCRDRWQTLSREKAAMSEDYEDGERARREKSLRGNIDSELEPTAAKSRRVQVNGDNRVEYLVNNQIVAASVSQENGPSSSSGQKEEKDTKKSETATSPEAKSDEDMEVESPLINELRKTVPPLPLRAIVAGRKKRKGMPLSIPGMVPGSPVQLVPSHATHMQAVAASATAQMSSGRTELWPLQILDLRDKQRAAMLASSGKSSSSKTFAPPPPAAASAPSPARAAAHAASKSSSSATRPAPPPPAAHPSSATPRAYAPPPPPPPSAQAPPSGNSSATKKK